MYHCHTQFFLISRDPQLTAVLKGMPPLQAFTHEFLTAVDPDLQGAAQADVIIADLRGLAADAVLDRLFQLKKPDAQLLVLADEAQAAGLGSRLDGLQAVWRTPLSEEELRFHFLRWQQGYKQGRELWQTGQFLEATINGMPNLVWYKDKNGIHEKVNDSFCRTVNKTHQQVEGRGHAYIWDVEQDDPACIESEERVMRSRQTLVSEETIQTGEGQRLLTTYKSPLYDLDGSVMGTVGVAIDVTRERAYEQEIIDKNRTLESIFTTMDGGVMCHSLDGSKIISINGAALRILGYGSQEEMLQDGFRLVAATVVEGDRQRLQDSILSLKKAEDTVGVEYRVRHKNGEILHVMGSVKLAQENGELFYQRFMLDCTAQKLREEQERTETEQRQRDLIHALSADYSLACFFDLDTGNGALLRTSDGPDRAFADAFENGVPFYQSIRRYIEEFVHPDDRQLLAQATTAQQLQAELGQKKTVYMNYRAQLGGETLYYQLKAVRAGSWADHRGVVLGFRNVDDETRREMEKTNLLQDALSQANRASRAKSVFLSNMSHDIRTPMNAIVGFTSLALTHIDKKDQVNEYLKKILTSGNHLVSLINDVLDMSRIESGKMRLAESLCHLPDILHGLRSMVQAEVRAKQLDFYIDTVDVFDEDLYCDKLRLNQLLLNLLSNSIKYTPAGGIVSMRITQRPGAPAGYANYEFVIKDTGIGMSAEFVSHIFEPFERERNSTISGIQGTGLGMAITKNIVDMMNGAIEVKSEQGAGTEFTVKLALRLYDGPREMQAIPQLKNCRALVVDDDFNTCDSVSYMLTQFGLRAEWTLSGKEAVLRTRQAVMRGDLYSVYLIDWLMPDMNGIEVARRIRMETGEKVPIIVLTAYDWSDIEEEAKQAGVTAFCAKPLFLSELRSCLHSIVAGEDEKAAAAPVGCAPHAGRILLAEDNELNQEIATAILEEAGFSVDVAANGQIALEMLKASASGYYRVILMDVQMPVMDGYAATRAIRSLKNPSHASIPILAMTANAFEEDRRQALDCGMNGHIAKPIDVEKLMATLDTVLA